MRALSLFVALVSAATASAQVGHLPQNSPYRDLPGGQELTLFGGYFKGGQDIAGVLPQSGPVLGIRYEIHVGGPAQIMARYARVQSSRLAIDPTKPRAARSLGTHDVSLNLVDLDLTVNLTGQKSFHHIVPVANIGAGIASCSCSFGSDPYTFGTPFAFSLGGGLRYVPGGHFQVRVDVNDYLYQLKHPSAYYVNSSDGTPVLGSAEPRSFWKSNPTITIGVSRLFFR